MTPVDPVQLGTRAGASIEERAGAKRIVLASASRVRHQMLINAGLASVEVIPATVDEDEIRASLLAESDCIEPDMVAGVLARAKAQAVSALHPGALVIGADQVLALGTRMFQKAADRAEARDHLDRFRGRTHDLHAAVVIAEDGEAVWGLVDSARLTMRDFSDAFLDSYLDGAGDAPLRSVGAYELEHTGVQLFDRIEGDYFTILGMPLLPLLAQLRLRGALAQ